MGLFVSETMCADVQMGFCMESSGMTQAGQGEVHADFEPHLRDDVESMEDGQDPEVPVVHCFLVVTFSYYLQYLKPTKQTYEFTYLIADADSLDL